MKRASIREFVNEVTVVDVHEHHFPEVIGSGNVNLLRLFRESYAGWTTRRPYLLPSEVGFRDIDSPAVERTSWEALAPYLEGSGSNSFVRNLVSALKELYGLRESDLTCDNWESLDESVQSHHRLRTWPMEVLKRAGIERVITDPYTDPLLDARKSLGPQYNAVLRINAFACGWHPDSHDHNGNSAPALLSRLQLLPRTFDDYLDALEEVVSGCALRNQVGLKNALAYDRYLDFDEPDLMLAREAWGKSKPPPAERKAFSDFVVDRFCRLASKFDIPMQIHVGTAIIRGSGPMAVAGLVERHPSTRFLLMHLAYPWSRDLLGMAFVYRNIWLDLSWSHLLSPTHFKLALHEAVENLPDETRMMIGGDNLHIEETYGAIKRARQLISAVIDEKITEGYISHANAERLAKKILRENAIKFFQLH
jgi:hypothetical protein